MTNSKDKIENFLRKFESDICPVCLDESNTNLFSLSCLHKIHLECIKKSIKLECPLCRKKPLNLPIPIQKQINKNASQYKEEVEEDNRRQAMESIIDDNFLPPIELEIPMALKYLNSILKIPLCLIPDIYVEFTDSRLSFIPHGYLFDIVVTNIVEFLNSIKNDDNTNFRRKFDDEEENNISFAYLSHIDENIQHTVNVKKNGDIYKMTFNIKELDEIEID